MTGRSERRPNGDPDRDPDGATWPKKRIRTTALIITVFYGNPYEKWNIFVAVPAYITAIRAYYRHI